MPVPCFVDVLSDFSNEGSPTFLLPDYKNPESPPYFLLNNFTSVLYDNVQQTASEN